MWLIATKDKVLESRTNVKHYFREKGLKYVIPKVYMQSDNVRYGVSMFRSIP